MAVGKAGFLGFPKGFLVTLGQGGGSDLLPDPMDLPKLGGEPQIDPRLLGDLLGSHPDLKGLVQISRSFRGGALDSRANDGFVEFLVRELARLKSLESNLERTHRLLKGLLEGAADGHGFAHRLHRGGQGGVGLGELFESEAGKLGDHVIDGGLETGGGLLGDVILQLVEGIPDREFGGELGNGETGGLGGERRTAGDPRVHLDDHHAPVLRVGGELNVAASGLHADLADAGEGGVPHQLVLLVGQGHRGSDGDGVAGVHSHGIKILDRTNDHALVLVVTHHFHLVFLPTEQALFHEHLIDRRGIQTKVHHFIEFLPVVGNASSGSAQGVGGTQNDGKITQFVEVGTGLFQRMNRKGTGHVQTNVKHGPLEEFAVLPFLDGRGLGPDHLHAMLLENAGLVQIEGEVQSGLSAQSGKKGIGLFLFDDAGHAVHGKRFDVGGVGKFRVRHDRRRVAVDQGNTKSFLAQGFAGLGSAVVEFTSLTNDDRARTNDQDMLDVVSSRHAKVWIFLQYGTAAFFLNPFSMI